MSEEGEDPLERAEAAIGVAKYANERLNELEERLEDLETENDQLRHELEKEREKGEREERLFADVRQNMTNKPEERAVTLIRALNNEACTDKSIGGAAKAQMDVSQARSALGGSVVRQIVYPTFERAEELIDDADVLEYVKEDRSSSENSRLRLNLEGDRELPGRVAGHKIHDPTANPLGGDN